MNSSMYRNLTITALLMALAIMIPIIMPLKVVIPPASYTLASHVPIFLAMFLSRKMTACVVIGSTLGFFVAGFPIVKFRYMEEFIKPSLLALLSSNNMIMVIMI